MMKFKEITDEMIGMDDKICNCASVVVDMIIAQENKEEPAPLPALTKSIKKKRQKRNT